MNAGSPGVSGLSASPDSARLRSSRPRRRSPRVPGEVTEPIGPTGARRTGPPSRWATSEGGRSGRRQGPEQRRPLSHCQGPYRSPPIPNPRRRASGCDASIARDKPRVPGTASAASVPGLVSPALPRLWFSRKRLLGRSGAGPQDQSIGCGQTGQGRHRRPGVAGGDVAEDAARHDHLGRDRPTQASVVPASARSTSTLSSPAACAASRAEATFRSSNSTNRARTSPRRGWPARTPITSRPCPAHRLISRTFPGEAWSSSRRRCPCTSSSRRRSREPGSS